MVLRGWGARVCAFRKSRTRAREPGGGSRPGLLSLGHHHCLPPLSLAARRSIRLPRTCRAPLCLICPQVVWWRWRWWRRRAAHRAIHRIHDPRLQNAQRRHFRKMIARPRLARRLAAAPPRSWTTPSRHSPTPARAQHAVQFGCGAELLSVRPPLRLVVWVRLLAGQGAETDGSSGVVAGVFSRPSGSRRRRARRSRRRRSTTTPALLPDRYRGSCRPSVRQCAARLYRRSSAPSS